MKYYALVIITVFIVINPYTSSAYAINDQVRTMDNQLLELSSFEGELLVLEAFSTTCSHCIDYHPDLKTIYSEFSDQISMLSVSINTDDTLNTLKDFNSDHPTDWTLALDEDNSLSSEFNLYGTPTTMFINRAGDLKACYVGRQDVSDLRTELTGFIADPTGFEGPLEDGVCEGASALEQFMGSIFFPITLGLALYGIYLAVRYLIRKRTTV